MVWFLGQLSLAWPSTTTLRRARLLRRIWQRHWQLGWLGRRWYLRGHSSLEALAGHSHAHSSLAGHVHSSLASHSNFASHRSLAVKVLSRSDVIKDVENLRETAKVLELEVHLGHLCC